MCIRDSLLAVARKNAQIDAAEKDLLLLSGAVLDAAQDLLARHFAQLVDRLSHQTYRRGFEERLSLIHI